MRHKKDAFKSTVEELWALMGWRPVAHVSAGSARLIIDNVAVTLTDKGRHLLIQGDVQRLPAEASECVQQVRSALKVNLGLLLSCQASLHLVNREDGSYLTSFATYRYAVNHIDRLVAAIEDTVNLVEFFKQVSVENNLPSAISEQGRDTSSFVFVP